jgi:hypothetical protein
MEIDAKKPSGIILRRHPLRFQVPLQADYDIDFACGPVFYFEINSGQGR